MYRYRKFIFMRKFKIPKLNIALVPNCFSKEQINIMSSCENIIPELIIDLGNKLELGDIACQQANDGKNIKLEVIKPN